MNDASPNHNIKKLSLMPKTREIGKSILPQRFPTIQYVNKITLTHMNMLKKEKATPLLAQLKLEVGRLLLPSCFLHWSAMYTNATNHMKAHSPLAAASTMISSFFT